MRETERRGRMLLIAAALTGALMLVLAGVLATAGLPGASLSPASMPRPAGHGLAERGSSIESAPATAPSYLPIPRRGAQPYPRGVPRRSVPASPRPTSPRPAPSGVPPSSSGPVFRTNGEAGTGTLAPTERARARATPAPTRPRAEKRATTGPARVHGQR